MLARLVGALPSPHSTVNDATVPSGSVAEKVTVTVSPVVAGLGATLLTTTIGDLSLIVSWTDMDPVPPLFAAETVIVNTCDVALPVEA